MSGFHCTDEVDETIARAFHCLQPVRVTYDPKEKVVTVNGMQGKLHDHRDLPLLIFVIEQTTGRGATISEHVRP